MKRVFSVSAFVFVVIATASLSGCDAQSFEDCDKPCTKEYNPVCASSGRDPPSVFGNPCLLFVYNCNLTDTDRLLAVDMSECNTRKASDPAGKCQLCPQIYKPICAGNYAGIKTFDNACLMELENCVNENHGGARFRFIHEGPCVGNEVVEPFNVQD